MVPEKRHLEVVFWPSHTHSQAYLHLHTYAYTHKPTLNSKKWELDASGLACGIYFLVNDIRFLGLKKLYGHQQGPKEGRNCSLKFSGTKRRPEYGVGGEDRANLTSILIIFIHAGDVRAAHEEDGVNGDGLGTTGAPCGRQRHLEVDPGLPQGDEVEHQHTGYSQYQAKVPADLLGFEQQSPVYGHQ